MIKEIHRLVRFIHIMAEEFMLNSFNCISVLLVYGDHTTLAYSRIGRTNEIYRILLVLGFLK